MFDKGVGAGLYDSWGSHVWSPSQPPQWALQWGPLHPLVPLCSLPLLPTLVLTLLCAAIFPSIVMLVVNHHVRVTHTSVCTVIAAVLRLCHSRLISASHCRPSDSAVYKTTHASSCLFVCACCQKRLVQASSCVSALIRVKGMVHTRLSRKQTDLYK